MAAKHGYRIVSHPAIVAHQRCAFDDCLGDEHVIEGVAMMPFEGGQGDEVRRRERELIEPAVADRSQGFADVEAELAYADLDRNFP